MKTVLMVAEKPSLAQSIATILSRSAFSLVSSENYEKNAIEKYNFFLQNIQYKLIIVISLNAVLL